MQCKFIKKFYLIFGEFREISEWCAGIAAAHQLIDENINVIITGNPLHIYFKCSKCDSIIDIDNKDLNLEYIKLNKRVEEGNNLAVFDVNIMLIGTCSKCKEDK